MLIIVRQLPSQLNVLSSTMQCNVQFNYGELTVIRFKSRLRYALLFCILFLKLVLHNRAKLISDLQKYNDKHENKSVFCSFSFTVFCFS
ncbi:hypothetical protein HanPI659440_Chr16g0642791 [Helianthus annuus]|nr:hypothetical protein HanPI659440_Chr16g0642791 [Helianthus annuus]